MARLRHILDRRFRASREWDLADIAELPENLRASLRETAGYNDGAAALLPRPGNRLSAKIVSSRAAQLLRTLSVEGFLPGDIRSRGEQANRDIARLVLDEALEIEDRDRFSSGPRAHAALFCRTASPPPTGRLADLSLRAIRYGQALEITDVPSLARRLYTFGTIPRGPRWELLIGGADGIALLGLHREGRTRQNLARSYQASTHPNWLSWAMEAEHGRQRPELPYKLYVSPRPEALARCFPILAGVLSERHVWSFKVGRGVPGLLRSDKFVAYFEDLVHLRKVAEILADALKGCPAQGVPFTAPASEDGLLSWGVDPPSAGRPGARESWRYRLTNQLASGIVSAQSAATHVEPWEFALDRLSLDCVDPFTWTPVGSGRPQRLDA
jgi:hypothetical protein